MGFDSSIYKFYLNKSVAGNLSDKYNARMHLSVLFCVLLVSILSISIFSCKWTPQQTILDDLRVSCYEDTVSVKHKRPSLKIFRMLSLEGNHTEAFAVTKRV